MVLRDGTNRRVFTGEILFDRRLIQRDFLALTTVVAAGRARTGKVGDKGRFSDGDFFHYTGSGIKKGSFRCLDCVPRVSESIAGLTQ